MQGNYKFEFKEKNIKKRENDLYLSDEQIDILKKYDFNYLNYTNIESLIFDIELYLNESYQELDDLEQISSDLSEFKYYHNTNK